MRLIQRHFLRFIFYFYWQLICLGPQTVVVDFVWPFHNHDSSEASLTNVCILFTLCLVVVNVSEVYNRTDLTLEFHILILVFSLISFDFQILLSLQYLSIGHIDVKSCLR